MIQLLNIYHELFPKTGIADWFYAFAGVILHVLLKIKNIPWERFDLRIWLHHNILSVVYSLITIFICLSILPTVYAGYNGFDSVLIGYCSNSLFKQLLKNRSTIIRKL